ncbi:hypothetical protein Hamer_G010517 [Homarus americanus]|uniref:Uncharacterized protein n=1 Tax=Homarus americanus TaxID=6706 RepID=A0A8J5K562_HOMAM|nr:hypothetical protein Hamer_G010517 [Homarus americanus]
MSCVIQNLSVSTCETGGADVAGGGGLRPSSLRSGGDTSGRIDEPLPPLLPAAECGGDTGPGDTLPLCARSRAVPVDLMMATGLAMGGGGGGGSIEPVV